ncbi:MAG: nucleoside diphosphate kinase regulator [Tsuneonella sp.]
MTTSPAAARPPITLAEREADALSELALSNRERHPTVSRLLLEEIDRSETLPDAEMPADVVRMGSQVSFVDARTGERRTVTLVYPGAADLAAGLISILTPVGAGLIGLQVGQSISWPDRSGAERLLTIEDVCASG